jgi:hypothetical protein
MLRLITLAAAATLALSAPASAQEEWKWGVNFYDLQLHSIPADDSAVAADICSSALIAMVALMQDEQGDPETIDQLRTFGFAWKEEGANRREVDLETYNEKYLLPAFGLMRDLRIEHHTFWTEYCLDLTRRAVEARDE